MGKVVIYGNETWLYGIGAFAVFAVLGSGIGSLIESRKSKAQAT